MTKVEIGREAPEMVERVALAIIKEIRSQGEMCALLFDGDDDGPIWQGKLEATVDGLINVVAVARAAIQAMREPSPGMLSRGGYHCIQGAGGVTKSDKGQAKAVYRAMIDRALVEADDFAALSDSRTGAE